MSQSTNVEKSNDKLAMVVGLDFVNGKEFKKSIEMHPGKDGEISAKSNKEQKVEISKEALNYYIDRWTEAIKLLEIRGEIDKVEKYKKSIKTAKTMLNTLEKDDEEMSK